MPLVAWSIEHARNTPLISRTFVSTDSFEIGNVARQFGAEVIQRPPEISGDTASSESCLLHALDHLKGKFDLEPDLVVFLQPTSPLRETDDIQRAIETMEREQADSLFSACRVEGFVWRVDKGASPRSFTYDHGHRPRRQDAPEDLIENGSIYVFKPWVLRQLNNRLGGKIAVHRMAALNSCQIDEPSDLELVDYLMARRHVGMSSGPDHRGPETGMPVHQTPALTDLGQIRLLALDFDGVLTDNRVLVSQDGTESVLCDRGDGLGLGLLKVAGVEILVLSKERNPVVAARCQKLGIEFIQGCDDKLTPLRKRAEAGSIRPEEIAYVGNDLNDLECLGWVGMPIAVGDAVPEVLAVARWKTTKHGGRGAVREICDLLLQSRQKV